MVFASYFWQYYTKHTVFYIRVIPEEKVEKTDDNIADIVSHHNLQLADLWEKYKVELQESEVIKHLQEEKC